MEIIQKKREKQKRQKEEVKKVKKQLQFSLQDCIFTIGGCLKEKQNQEKVNLK